MIFLFWFKENRILASPQMTSETFRLRPAVLEALEHPRSPRSVLNYMCGANTADPDVRKTLNTEDSVAPLLGIWFGSGTELDDLCQPFAPVIRELKANPATLVGAQWESIEGRVAKVLLADQLSRSCFRGTSEAFSFDPIGRALVRELVSDEAVDETLKLPAALLYLLPWALAHSEDLSDLERACEVIDLAASAKPGFKLFKGRNRQVVDQHRQVLERFGRYPQRNEQFGRKNTQAEQAWLDDKENLPIWAGGRGSIDKQIK
jgi:uncharacterized protein (DUF924 family)